MEIPVIILFLCCLGLFAMYSNAKTKIDHYENFIPQLIDEWERLEKLLDNDSKNKLNNFKKMLTLTWKYTKFNDTHKN